MRFWEGTKNAASAALAGDFRTAGKHLEQAGKAVSNAARGAENAMTKAIYATSNVISNPPQKSFFATEFAIATEKGEVGKMFLYGSARLLEKAGEGIQYVAIAAARKVVPLINKAGADLKNPKQIQFSVVDQAKVNKAVGEQSAPAGSNTHQKDSSQRKNFLTARRDNSTRGLGGGLRSKLLKKRRHGRPRKGPDQGQSFGR